MLDPRARDWPSLVQKARHIASPAQPSSGDHAKQLKLLRDPFASAFAHTRGEKTVSARHTSGVGNFDLDEGSSRRAEILDNSKDVLVCTDRLTEARPILCDRSSRIFRLAKVAELADAPDLGSGGREAVGVRVPPFAPTRCARLALKEVLSQQPSAFLVESPLSHQPLTSRLHHARGLCNV